MKEQTTLLGKDELEMICHLAHICLEITSFSIDQPYNANRIITSLLATNKNKIASPRYLEDYNLPTVMGFLAHITHDINRLNPAKKLFSLIAQINPEEPQQLLELAETDTTLSPEEKEYCISMIESNRYNTTMIRELKKTYPLIRQITDSSKFIQLIELFPFFKSTIHYYDILFELSMKDEAVAFDLASFLKACNAKVDPECQTFQSEIPLYLASQSATANYVTKLGYIIPYTYSTKIQIGSQILREDHFNPIACTKLPPDLVATPPKNTKKRATPSTEKSPKRQKLSPAESDKSTEFKTPIAVRLNNWSKEHPGLDFPSNQAGLVTPSPIKTTEDLSPWLTRPSDKINRIEEDNDPSEEITLNEDEALKTTKQAANTPSITAEQLLLPDTTSSQYESETSLQSASFSSFIANPKDPENVSENPAALFYQQAPLPTAPAVTESHGNPSHQLRHRK